MENTAVQLLIALLILGAAAGIAIVLSRPARRAPRSIYAVVVSKRTYTWPERIGYYVTFQTQEAQAIEAEVTHDWYVRLAPGDHGQIALAGGQFLGFYKVS